MPAAFSFNNTRQFLAGLNSIKENNGGNTFIGIVHASELVPYDSAVFISTAAIPPHTELVQDAAITLLKKRIRVCQITINSCFEIIITIYILFVALCVVVW